MNSSMAAPLYHLAPLSLYEQFKDAGAPYQPPTYVADGFTHLTADPSLLLTVANHFYAKSQGSWVVLVLEPTKLAGEVRYEPAAAVGGQSSTGMLGSGQQQQQEGQPAQQRQAPPGEPLFPHLYSRINLEAVLRVLPVQRGTDGTFLSIQGLPAAAAPANA